MGNLKYQPAVPALTKLLEHPEAETRKSAALSLMKIGDRDSIVPLKTALECEKEPNIQKAIALAISLLQKQTLDDW